MHVYVNEETLPQAWEKAVKETWDNGEPFRTEYDNENDLASKDSTAMIVVRDPMREPRLHRIFPGGIDDLEIFSNFLV